MAPTGEQAVLAARIDALLRERARPERAEGEKAYLKSSLEHYGASMPAIRSAVREVVGSRADQTHDDMVGLVRELWRVPVHERRAAAVEVLTAQLGVLRADDIGLLEQLLRESRTWALVDGLAASVVGPLVERFPELGGRLEAWAQDEDFWIRRSSLLALLLALRRGEGDWARFARYADAMLEEKEFFIRKAIGWVLRDTGRKRPDLVFEWLAPRAARASGVTVREAIRPLDAEQREAITAARAGSGRRSTPALRPTRPAGR